MTLKDLMELANSEVVFAVLFIAGLFFAGRWLIGHLQSVKEENKERETQLIELYKTQIDSSTEREEHLKAHLDKSNEQMGEIASTMKDIQQGMSKLENKMDNNFKDVWREIGRFDK
jgi:predicted RNase H-like nuclease (RuvC/YqgF family)